MTKFIGIKQLHTDLKNITKQVQTGEVFVVSKNNQPIFTIQPFIYGNESKKENNGEKFSLTDLETLQFRSGVKDASQQVDKVVYNQQ